MGTLKELKSKRVIRLSVEKVIGTKLMTNKKPSLVTLVELDELIDVVDIGANPNDGVAPYKNLLDENLARVFGFEPNEDALGRLNAMKGPNETYIGKAVYDGSQQQLKICQAEGMTSLLEPNMKLLRYFNGFPRWGKVKERLPIQTIRLDDVEEIQNIDYLKIDIQGGELEVFKNATNSLDKCCVIQTEVEFLPMYEGQPLFSEVEMFLRGLGFVFHRFSSLVSRIIKPLQINNDVLGELSQVTWADAIFIKDFTKFNELDQVNLKKTAVILNDIYGSFDIVMRALMVIDEKSNTNYSKQYLKYLS